MKVLAEGPFWPFFWPLSGEPILHRHGKQSRLRLHKQRQPATPIRTLERDITAGVSRPAELLVASSEMEKTRKMKWVGGRFLINRCNRVEGRNWVEKISRKAGGCIGFPRCVTKRKGLQVLQPHEIWCFTVVQPPHGPEFQKVRAQPTPLDIQ